MYYVLKICQYMQWFIQQQSIRAYSFQLLRTSSSPKIVSDTQSNSTSFINLTWMLYLTVVTWIDANCATKWCYKLFLVAGHSQIIRWMDRCRQAFGRIGVSIQQNPLNCKPWSDNTMTSVYVWLHDLCFLSLIITVMCECQCNMLLTMVCS